MTTKRDEVEAFVRLSLEGILRDSVTSEDVSKGVAVFLREVADEHLPPIRIENSTAHPDGSFTCTIVVPPWAVTPTDTD